MVGKHERKKGSEAAESGRWIFKGEELEQILSDYGRISPGKTDEYLETITDEASREKARIALFIVIPGIRVGRNVQDVKKVTVSESSGGKGDKLTVRYTYETSTHRKPLGIRKPR